MVSKNQNKTWVAEFELTGVKILLFLCSDSLAKQCCLISVAISQITCNIMSMLIVCVWTQSHGVQCFLKAEKLLNQQWVIKSPSVSAEEDVKGTFPLMLLWVPVTWWDCLTSGLCSSRWKDGISKGFCPCQNYEGYIPRVGHSQWGLVKELHFLRGFSCT